MSVGGITLGDVGERSDFLQAVRDGDEGAWAALVGRYLSLVHGVCRAHGLDDGCAAQVNTVVWLRVAERLARVQRSESLGPWIAATARYECVRASRRRPRCVAAAGERRAGGGGDGPGVALGALAPLQRDVLELLAVEPRPSYAEVGAALALAAREVEDAEAVALAELRARVVSPSWHRGTDGDSRRRRPGPVATAEVLGWS